VPIIKALREGLTANRIEWIAGIINGTSNFILSEDAREGSGFKEVLAEAQRLGYAEADPTFDVEGVDAAHKLTIMAAIAYGIRCSSTKPIRRASPGLPRKIFAMPRNSATGSSCSVLPGATSAGIELRVHPTLIPSRRLIANVEGVMNAILVQETRSEPRCTTARRRCRADRLSSGGRSGGRDPDAYRRSGAPGTAPGVQPDRLSDTPILAMEEVETSYTCGCGYWIAPACFADITRILADMSISIDAMVQKEPSEGEEQVTSSC